ncbi:MAG: glycosyltransferase family 2 protein [candidate division FCPU426 bacterium]
MSIHIVVLNYNGVALLQECLPSVAAAAKASPVPCKLSVLDNVSKDQSRDWVVKALPEVGWIQAPANRILFSYIDVVRELPEEYVLLLNNDIKVEPDFIAPLWAALSADPEAFLASPKNLSFEGFYNGGRHACGLRYAIPWAGPVYPGNLEAAEKTGYTLYTANGLFRRDRFVALGGFDPLFTWPGCWEDTDLGTRAWKRGWTCLYVPQSVIFHKGSATLEHQYEPYQRKALGWRNGFIWFYANVSSPRLRLKFLLLILPTLLAAAVTGRFFLVDAFFRSLASLPKALKRRGQERAFDVQDDETVWRRCREDF